MSCEWMVTLGDCRVVLAGLEPQSVDAVVCDPPYELTSGGKGGFMGKAWDGTGVAFDPAMWGEVLRVLKPGGHLLAFGGTRTFHRMTVAIEDAGFEIRDCLSWLYGSGFPKSLNVGKAIDKAAGVEREVIGERPQRGRPKVHEDEFQKNTSNSDVEVLTAPTTPEARQWEGWGTALKPAWEPIVMARKPLIGTVAGNVLAHGTGGLNIDGSRIATTDALSGGHATAGQQMSDGWHRPWMDDPAAVAANAERSRASVAKSEALGRWPANVLLDEGAAAALDEQSGVSASANGVTVSSPTALGQGNGWNPHNNRPVEFQNYGDKGGASRFFYVAKASRRDRNEGLDGMPEKEWKEQGFRDNETTHLSPRAGAGRTSANANHHPTVKPTALMRHLVRLVTPPGGLVLDPFTGSGSTGKAAILEGFRFHGIEQDAEYAEIARARIAWAEQQVDAKQPTLM